MPPYFGMVEICLLGPEELEFQSGTKQPARTAESSEAWLLPTTDDDFRRRRTLPFLLARLHLVVTKPAVVQ